MKRIRSGVMGLLTILVLAALLVGCTRPATPESTAGGIEYSGALDLAYEDAPDVTTLLALGTLRLEDTGDAVDEEQAARLLPLWKSLQGSALQGDAERSTVIRQIEGTMSQAQVAAMAAMRLTQEDVQSWMQSRGAGFQAPADEQGSGRRQGQGGVPSGMTEEQIAQMRQRFQNVSPPDALSGQDLATRRAQFGASGAAQGGPAGGVGRLPGGSFGGLIDAVITLLSERAGVPPEWVTARPRPEQMTPTPSRMEHPASVTPTSTPVTPTPEADNTDMAAGATKPTPEPTAAATPPDASSAAEPVVYSVRAGDSLAAIARAYGVTVAAIAEANGLADANQITVGQRLVIPDPSRVPAVTSGLVPAASSPEPTLAPPGALEWLPDNDPGPPFTVEVSANRATQDPLVEKSRQYLVTGLVRNVGDRTYAVSSIDVTFFDASGFRGTFRKYPLVPGGEWLWHGKTQAEFPCMLLAPGEACPFLVEITAQDMASFLIHPNGAPTERESVQLEPGGVRVVEDGTGYVRISGTVTNSSSLKAKNVTVAGVLLDANGEIVSLGSTYVLQENIEPGASVSFDLRIAKQPYTRYQLYAQAERDWQ